MGLVKCVQLLKLLLEHKQQTSSFKHRIHALIFILLPVRNADILSRNVSEASDYLAALERYCNYSTPSYPLDKVSDEGEEIPTF